jgi:hypothetical protein
MLGTQQKGRLDWEPPDCKVRITSIPPNRLQLFDRIALTWRAVSPQLDSPQFASPGQVTDYPVDRGAARFGTAVRKRTCPTTCFLSASSAPRPRSDFSGRAATKHFIGHFFGKYMICLALFGERDFDSKLCQVGWCGPEPGCGHPRVNVPAAMNNFPTRVGAGRSVSGPIGRSDNRSTKSADGRVATEAAWLNRNNLEKGEIKKKKEKMKEKP